MAAKSIMDNVVPSGSYEVWDGFCIKCGTCPTEMDSCLCGRVPQSVGKKHAEYWTAWRNANDPEIWKGHGI